MVSLSICKKYNRNIFLIRGKHYVVSIPTQNADVGYSVVVYTARPHVADC
jgi:hypothetical protein